MEKIKNIKQIYIGNILESFYRSYEKLPSEEKNYWSKYDTLENNRSLLYGKDNKIIITPRKINQLHFDYIKSLSNWINVYNLFPKICSSSICTDIQKDTVLLKQLEYIIKENPGVEIIAYRNTPEFYLFIEHLKQQRLDFSLPESFDEDDKFIEKYFHSKRGFRHMWEMVKDLKFKINIPFGFITADKEEAIRAAHWFVKKGKNYVIKYNYGVQGVGMLIFDNICPNDSYAKFEQYLGGKLSDSIWNEGCIVVEECIKKDNTKFGGSPNVEMRIFKDGSVHKEYACEQMIADDKKTFLGVGMNPEVDNSPYIQTAYQAAEIYGQKLSALGYKGYFDMDLVISEDDQLYAVEANLRRTGGTHINDLCKSILGDNYSSNYFVASTEIKLGKNKDISYQSLLEIYKDILFDADNKLGVILYNPDLMEVGVIQILYIEKTRSGLDRLIDRSNKLIN